MQTFEFKMTPQNGMIKRPSQFQQWDDKQVRVILLIEEVDSTTQIQKDRYAFDAVSLKTKRFRFNREFEEVLVPTVITKKVSMQKERIALMREMERQLPGTTGYEDSEEWMKTIKESRTVSEPKHLF